MPQIYVPSTGLDDPVISSTFKIFEKGLRASTYVPTLTHVNTPTSLKAIYQLCGKVCFVSIKLDYSSATPSWTTTPYITLPFRASAYLAGIVEPPLTIYELTGRKVISYALFDGSDRGRVSLPTTGTAANEIYVISGFYWVD